MIVIYSNIENNSNNIFIDDLNYYTIFLKNNINTNTNQNLQKVNLTNDKNVNDSDNKENRKM